MGTDPSADAENIIDKGNENPHGKGIEQKQIFTDYGTVHKLPFLAKHPRQKGFSFGAAARSLRIGQAVDFTVNIHLTLV